MRNPGDALAALQSPDVDDTIRGFRPPPVYVIAVLRVQVPLAETLDE
jgi:hypothetical protein